MNWTELDQMSYRRKWLVIPSESSESSRNQALQYMRSSPSIAEILLEALSVLPLNTLIFSLKNFNLIWNVKNFLFLSFRTQNWRISLGQAIVYASAYWKHCKNLPSFQSRIVEVTCEHRLANYSAYSRNSLEHRKQQKMRLGLCFSRSAWNTEWVNIFWVCVRVCV